MRAGGSRRDSLDLLQYGLHYAEVTQNKDDEKKLNRIKVKFAWLDNGDKDQSAWAQLMTPMEGPKFGWYNVPEVGDIVVVAFIHGDISQPVIIGGVWSTKDVSPEPNEDGKNNFRGYRSRSGHRLILDDSGKTKIVLADKSTKLMVGIGNFATEGAGPNICAVYKPPMSGDTGVSVSSMEGGVDVTCKDGKLLIKADQNVKISAKTTIDISAGSNMTVEGSSATKLTAGSPTSLDAPTVNIG
ncbi:MAG: phage baseplate assembly protein V [Proteobacteria bacterium]|nr:phage baseplate assembly protein V [Pseudomonadota bacterium]